MPWKALATLGGSIIGAFGQHATNMQNMRIAQMNNHYNRMMMQEQNQWNLDHWHRMNAYNDPSAQRKRLEKAGINPAIALGSISPGQAESLTSAGAHPAETPQLSNPMQPLADGITNSMNQYLQAKGLEAQVRKTMAEAETIETTNKNLEQRLSTQDEGYKKDNLLKDAQIDMQALDYLSKQSLLPHQVEYLQAQIKGVVADNELKEVEQKLKLHELNFLRPAQVANMKAHTSNLIQSTVYMMKQGLVAEAQISFIAHKIAESVWTSENIQANTEYIKSNAEYIKAKKETEDVVRKELVSKYHLENKRTAKQNALLDRNIEYQDMVNESYDTDKLFQRIEQGGRALGNVAGAFKPFNINIDAGGASQPSYMPYYNQLPGSNPYILGTGRW